MITMIDKHNRSRRCSAFFHWAVAITILTSLQPMPAHEGHDHGAAPGTSGVGSETGFVSISEQAKANLEIEVAEVQILSLENTISAVGRIVAIPDSVAAVSSRIPGRVTALMVNPGQHVTKDQEVVEVESLIGGDPPPRVRYSAPISGTVVHSEVVLGDAVEPNAHLMQLADLTEVYAEAKLFEGQLSTVEIGQNVRIRVSAFPGEIFEGEIELLSGELDPATLTLKAWVRLDNKEGRLRPNMQVRLEIVTGIGDSVIVVPKSAVIGSGGNLSVFVEQADAPVPTYEKRLVVRGMEDDRYIEIIEGALPGEKVVTVGNYQLQFVPPDKAGPSSSDSAEASEQGTAGKDTGEGAPENASASGSHTASDSNSPGHAGDGQAAAEGTDSQKTESLLRLLAWLTGALIFVFLANLIYMITRGKPRPADTHDPSAEDKDSAEEPIDELEEYAKETIE